MPKKGYKQTKEHKQKVLSHPKHTGFQVGHNYGVRFQKGIQYFSRKGFPAWNKGTKGYNSGSNHWNWKGGITSIEMMIRKSFEYRQWRSDIFTRDNFVCQQCGYEEGRILEAHHIIFFSKVVSEYKIKTMKDALNCNVLWDINNGITLCQKCHTKAHK